MNLLILDLESYHHATKSDHCMTNLSNFGWQIAVLTSGLIWTKVQHLRHQILCVAGWTENQQLLKTEPPAAWALANRNVEVQLTMKLNQNAWCACPDHLLAFLRNVDTLECVAIVGNGCAKSNLQTTKASHTIHLKKYLLQRRRWTWNKLQKSRSSAHTAAL